MEQSVADHIPHTANVPGDFYVEDGCCTMCLVPFEVAPELFGSIRGPDGLEHCYVKKQPQSLLEMHKMIGAIRCAELQCIRYRGRDRIIQLHLLREGEGMVCDHLLPDLQPDTHSG
jgi:hypothetical protein